MMRALTRLLPLFMLISPGAADYLVVIETAMSGRPFAQALMIGPRTAVAVTADRCLDGWSEFGRCRIADSVSGDGGYYLAGIGEKTDRLRLREEVSILFESPDWTVIKIPDRSALERVNRLRVELKRLMPYHRDYPAIADMTPPRLAYDTLIQDMADMVSQDTILAVVRRLRDFRTRYSSTDSARACAAWLYGRFQQCDFDTVILDTFSPSYAPSVIAIKNGMIYPGRNYVVGSGHYDCTSQTPTTIAPGSNDNGSGTSAMMEATRILSRYQFEHGIRLIAFGGEEQGLLGSAYYANNAQLRQDTIVGVVNFDMFAYTTPNRDTMMIVNDTTYMDNLLLAQFFAACADSYVPQLRYRVWTGLRPYSDHASFAEYGFHAVQARENLAVSNPYYHTTGDTIGAGFNALEMCYQGIRAGIATIAALAVPYYPTAVAEPSGSIPDGPAIIHSPTIIRRGRSWNVTVRATGPFILETYDAAGRRSYTAAGAPGPERTVAMHAETAPGVLFLVLRTDRVAETRKVVVLP